MPDIKVNIPKSPMLPFNNKMYGLKKNKKAKQEIDLINIKYFTNHKYNCMVYYRQKAEHDGNRDILKLVIVARLFLVAHRYLDHPGIVASEHYKQNDVHADLDQNYPEVTD